MPLTPEDVSNKRFTPVRLREGYDMGEVDQFLDEVESELERLLKENEDLRSKLSAAQGGAPVPAAAPAEEKREEKADDKAEEKAEPAAPAQPVASPTETIKVTTAAEASSAATRLLELATRNADQVVEEARAEAEQIRAEARTQAEQVEQEARSRSQALDSETESKRRELFGDLEKEKSRLDADVENLRTFEREYRSRLKSYFTQQLEALEGHTDGAEAQNRLEADGQGQNQPEQHQG